MNSICALKGIKQCSDKNLTTYFPSTNVEITLCKQCIAEFGITLIVDAAYQKCDIELLFRDIMMDLAKKYDDA